MPSRPPSSAKRREQQREAGRADRRRRTGTHRRRDEAGRARSVSERIGPRRVARQRRLAAAPRRAQTRPPSARSRTNRIRRRPRCRGPTPTRRRHGERRSRPRARCARVDAAGASPPSAQAVLHQHGDGLHAVAPADLLALRAAARLEAHRPLDDAMAGAQQLGGDLRLDVEAVGFELAARARPRCASPCSRSPCRSAATRRAHWSGRSETGWRQRS